MTLKEKTKKKIIEKVDSVEAWETIPTIFEGISIVPLPEVDGHKNVLIELKIDDGEFRKIFLKNKEQLIRLRKICINPRLDDLMEFIEENYNSRKEKEIIEIEIEGVD